jgi:hypothetical protein
VASFSIRVVDEDGNGVSGAGPGGSSANSIAERIRPRAIGDFQGRKVVLLAGRFLFSDCLSHGLQSVGSGCGQIVEFDPDPVGNNRSARSIER